MAGRRVDDVVDERASPIPAARRRTRGGQAATRDGDDRSRTVERVVVAVGEADDPATLGRGARGGDVAAEADEHAGAAAPGGRRGLNRRGRGAVGAPRLGRGAEVELDARRHQHGARGMIDTDGLPAGHPLDGNVEGRPGPGDVGEGPVVARGGARPDRPSGRRGHPWLVPPRARPRVRPPGWGRPVPARLGAAFTRRRSLSGRKRLQAWSTSASVRSSAGAGHGQRGGLRDQEHRRGAERREADRRRGRGRGARGAHGHEPPDTTWGCWWLARGGRAREVGACVVGGVVRGFVVAAVVDGEVDGAVLSGGLVGRGRSRGAEGPTAPRLVVAGHGRDQRPGYPGRPRCRAAWSCSSPAAWSRRPGRRRGRRRPGCRRPASGSRYRCGRCRRHARPGSAVASIRAGSAARVAAPACCCPSCSRPDGRPSASLSREDRGAR